MGKRSKQGASLRAKKRAEETNRQLELSLTEQGEQERVQSKKDEELFVLDTDRKQTAAANRAAAARRADDERKEASKKRKREFSEREKRQIRRVLRNHGKEGAIALAESRAKGPASAPVTAKPTFDLWDESPLGASPAKNNGRKAITAAVPAFEPPADMAAKLSKRQIKARKDAQANAPPRLAVEVAHPGQSYHPDKEHHQDAIGEALSIEIRRNEAEEYKARPISEGMTAFTKECIVESSEEEDSSDEEEEASDINANIVAAKVIKRKEKLTRAQRNKQKRVRAEQLALKERRKHKQFLHQVNEALVHKKAVERAEKERLERQKEMAKLKLEKKLEPLGKDVWEAASRRDPVRAPSLPVALTEELARTEVGGGGGLRTVAPKGSLVIDRLESMVARGMMSKRKDQGRRVVQGKRRPKKRGDKNFGSEYLLN